MENIVTPTQNISNNNDAMLSTDMDGDVVLIPQQLHLRNQEAQQQQMPTSSLHLFGGIGFGEQVPPPVSANPGSAKDEPLSMSQRSPAESSNHGAMWSTVVGPTGSVGNETLSPATLALQPAMSAVSLDDGHALQASSASASGAPGNMSPPIGCVNVYVANLPPSADAVRIREVFASVGKVLHVKVLLDIATGVSRGIAFVMFEDLSTAKKACVLKNKTVLDAAVLQVRLAERSSLHASVDAHVRSHIVYIRNIPGDIVKEDVKAYCQKHYGQVNDVIAHPQSCEQGGPSPFNMVFVTFENIDDACHCVEGIDGKSPFALPQPSHPFTMAKMINDMGGEMRKSILLRRRSTHSTSGGGAPDGSANSPNNAALVVPNHAGGGGLHIPAQPMYNLSPPQYMHAQHPNQQQQQRAPPPGQHFMGPGGSPSISTLAPGQTFLASAGQGAGHQPQYVQLSPQGYSLVHVMGNNGTPQQSPASAALTPMQHSHGGAPLMYHHQQQPQQHQRQAAPPILQHAPPSSSSSYGHQPSPQYYTISPGQQHPSSSAGQSTMGVHTPQQFVLDPPNAGGYGNVSRGPQHTSAPVLYHHHTQQPQPTMQVSAYPPVQQQHQHHHHPQHNIYQHHPQQQHHQAYATTSAAAPAQQMTSPHQQQLVYVQHHPVQQPYYVMGPQ